MGTNGAIANRTNSPRAQEVLRYLSIIYSFNLLMGRIDVSESLWSNAQGVRPEKPQIGIVPHSPEPTRGKKKRRSLVVNHSDFRLNAAPGKRPNEICWRVGKRKRRRLEGGGGATQVLLWLRQPGQVKTQDSRFKLPSALRPQLALGVPLSGEFQGINSGGPRPLINESNVRAKQCQALLNKAEE